MVTTFGDLEVESPYKIKAFVSIKIEVKPQSHGVLEWEALLEEASEEAVIGTKQDCIKIKEKGKRLYLHHQARYKKEEKKLSR